jgi:ABC-2 type transport system permease protein
VPSGAAGLLRVTSDWNPVSAVAGSCRELFGNPEPAALSDAFPSQHPVFVAVMWSILIIAVCAPVASRILRKRTTD